ncbi:L-histidine N(alpha)-methyltransferase [uncultured Jannaschia sp.]|uniref:L-histidine N(alpha)-methyltransferase n=1 Tax=uncultured Jannaschia sp. TaxID=293347 RepID=UPI002637B951|nr:L-histidine N(alpha)-methyltransferase [uncultured Jannaschia sp.]
MMDGAPLPPPNPDLLHDALAGLTAPKKSLPPKWLYDARGSALFEAITDLPEYDLTRTETAILRAEAGRLARLVPPGGALVEFGSGASTKTRTLLDAGPHLGAYVPVDISEAFLAETATALRRDYPHLSIHPVAADFTAPVALPAELADRSKVGFFPGSTIGNLDPAIAVRLLAHARGWPDVRAFVLGIDLVKDEAAMVAAYDDAAGVTAAFIANILVRLNAEAAGEFDPATFAYRATWNVEAARIDMELVSRRAQTIRLADHEIPFEAGEPIHVSASRKYTSDSVAALVCDAGWHLDKMLTDPMDRFAVAILAPEV